MKSIAFYENIYVFFFIFVSVGKVFCGQLNSYCLKKMQHLSGKIFVKRCEKKMWKAKQLGKEEENKREQEEE